jgi:two-component system, NarL family, sensor histidine kinase FusK
MGKGVWHNAWLRQAVVALAYVASYEAAHQLSYTEFATGTAIRLLWLLFLPYRYWPALVVGEFVPNFIAVYPCLDQFGLLWVALRAIPPIAVMMPVIRYCRSRLALFPSRRLINIKALLICALATSLVLTAYTSAAMAIAHLHPNTLPLTAGDAFAVFTGFYFAILALVPWPLIVRYELRAGNWRDKLQRAMESKLMLEGMTVLIPATALLALAASRLNSNYAQLALMGMFLPVVWLTTRHGWRAAALGGTVTIICAAIMVPSEAQSGDMSAIQTEVFLGVAITSLFALGARISAHQAQEQRAVDGQQLAQQSYKHGEYRLRQAAHALDSAAAKLHTTGTRLMGSLEHLNPDIKSKGHYKQAIDAVRDARQVAESLHPIAWRERGLPAALQETIGRVLDDAGINYSCEIKGRGLTRMQPAVLSAAYRIVCEAVVLVTSRIGCASVRVSLRGGETNRMRWVIVRVDGSIDVMRVARAIHNAEDRRRLAVRLGASGLDIDQLSEHARVFDGELHQRKDDEHMRVTVLLHDAQRALSENAPVRLWVH